MDIKNLLKKKKKRLFCSAVIVAAGSGERMGTDKVLLDIKGKPVIIRTLLPFQKSDVIDEIIIVTKASNIQAISDLCRQYEITKVKKVIEGGMSRTESCLAGTSAVSDKAELIAIHDGARPFVTEKLICDTVSCASEYMAAVPAVKSVDTVKLVDDKGIIVACPDRNYVVNIQTPQVFNADVIKGALSSAVTKGLSLTDDSIAAEMMGVKVHTVEGDVNNIKLTVPEDMVIADSIIKSRGL